MPTIISGKRFMICDERGDVVEGAHGIYANDVRCVSDMRLHIGGRVPRHLAEHAVSSVEHRFVQHAKVEAHGAGDALLVERSVVAGDALWMRIKVSSLIDAPTRIDVELQCGGDLRDLFDVKHEVFSTVGVDDGDLAAATEIPTTFRLAPGPDGSGVIVPSSDGPRVSIDASPAGVVADGSIGWSVELDPHATWECDVRIAWDDAGRSATLDFDTARDEYKQEIDAWIGACPPLTTDGAGSLVSTWDTSVRDLAMLRIRVPLPGDRTGTLPAAGLPWFMTTFGRDTLICCLQSLVLGPSMARDAIEFLASRQATDDNPRIDAEPGKILHELREGPLAATEFGRYYGTIDATPLFIVLLDELHRWTGDDEFVRRYEQHARAALDWIERGGDVDDDGFIEYFKRSAHGLDNQSWRDSHDSQRFRDGRQATGHIAPLEAQGYAFDARRRMARLAREVWNDPDLARRMDADADQLLARIDAAYWTTPTVDDALSPDDPRAGGWFAMALDGSKQPVDAMTSNVGHLLWSGAVLPERIDACVRQLMDPAMSTGWGIRTMSASDAAYNPLAYHNGTVWPHDTAICAAGMIRAGAAETGWQVARALLDTAAAFDGRPPELFAGLDRAQTPFPVPYPTSSRPQAWAASASLMLMTAVLGIKPEPESKRLVSNAEHVPEWVDGVTIHGVPAFGRRWNVRASGDSVDVVPAARS